MIVKKLLSKIVLISLFLTTFMLAGSQPASAAGRLYLSPSSLTVSQGSSFSVAVRVNTGGSKVDAAQANLSYPTDKLDYLGVSYGGTAFEIQAESSGGGGKVKMGRATISAKSGDLLVGTITFRARVSLGSASVSFTSGTEADKGGSVVVSATSGATYSFKAAPAPPKPKPKDKTAPKISDLKITNLTKTSATVVWKTNENSDSLVDWGPSKKFGLVASNKKLVKSHSIKLDKRLLTPGSTYFYRTKSKDAAGNSAVSDVHKFSEPAYFTQITVNDAEGNNVEGAKVTLVGIGEASTDENGVATFKDVTPGEHAVLVEYQGKTSSQVIDVADKDGTQSYTAKVQGVVAKRGILDDNQTMALGVFAAAFLILVIAFVFRKKLLGYRVFSKYPD